MLEVFIIYLPLGGYLGSGQHSSFIMSSRRCSRLGAHVEKAVLPDDVIPPSAYGDSTDEDLEKLDKVYVAPEIVS